MALNENGSNQCSLKRSLYILIACGLIWISITSFILNDFSFVYKLVGVSLKSDDELLFDIDDTSEYDSVIKWRYEWTLNYNILQYSSVMLIDGEKVYVEGLAFINYLREKDIYRKKTIRCLVFGYSGLLRSEASMILSIPLMNSGGSDISLWKIKCEFSRKVFENERMDELKVAIVDTDDFKSVNDTSEDSRIPMNYIKYQQPTIFNTEKPKYTAVANCVHLVHRLKADRLKRVMNWLELQFKLGFKHITFYFYESNDEAKRVIQEKYSNDKVTIVDYRTNLTDVCKYEIEALSRTDTNSTVFKNMHDICLKAYDKHFTMKRGYTLNAHERINTNDCYQHYRYEYEYVTNYDFDELIFPREHNAELGPPNIDQMKCSQKPEAKNYSIYNYAKKMFEKHGEKRSCLLFDHVLFIQANQTFFDSLKNLINKTKDGSIELSAGLKEKMFFNFKAKTSETYANHLLNAYNLIKCLNLTYMNKTRFESEWNNVFATRINNRDGKSIFNTKYTEGINQHFASRSSAGSYFRVPTKDGFSSHFRETTKQFFYGQNQAISYFYIDSEYYSFLINA